MDLDEWLIKSYYLIGFGGSAAGVPSPRLRTPCRFELRTEEERRSALPLSADCVQEVRRCRGAAAVIRLRLRGPNGARDELHLAATAQNRSGGRANPSFGSVRAHIFEERRRREDEYDDQQEPEQPRAPHHPAHVVHHRRVPLRRFCSSSGEGAPPIPRRTRRPRSLARTVPRG